MQIGDNLAKTVIIVDEMDSRLMSALRHNARASLSDLALGLKMSRSTVRARIERLQQRGEIVGFTIKTRADVAQDPVRALMMIGIEGRGTERILRQLSGLPQVREVHSTNGRWDVIVQIGAETLLDLDEVLHRIRKLDGVTSSETSLLLRTTKSG